MGTWWLLADGTPVLRHFSITITVSAEFAAEACQSLAERLAARSAELSEAASVKRLLARCFRDGGFPARDLELEAAMLTTAATWKMLEAFASMADALVYQAIALARPGARTVLFRRLW